MISLSELEQIESNARSIVSEEEETLTEDKEQFSSKVKAVGELIMLYIALHLLNLACPHKKHCMCVVKYL